MKNVFIITPSYLIRKKRDFAAGLRQLSALGFNVVNPQFPETLPSPREKAEQLHAAFADPDIVKGFS
ncbi:LD-carboxypeptidase [Geothermobacter hydrogeniphilus]|uniref:LD-carboxypeptidase n=1 Tax=Geothermobacter hydrogeniphilus TaxID=1969733 RepID=UPI001FEA60E1|nr:LD-carboxypeptidase [Geothermobacter hydrogeniphilus]